MLNQFPPGQAPNDVNRQLPQGLNSPWGGGAGGQPNPYEQMPGALNLMSGINSPPAGAGGMGGPPGMLGMPPPGGAMPMPPSGVMPMPGGMPGGIPGGIPGGGGQPPGQFGGPTPGTPPPNAMGGGMSPPGGGMMGGGGRGGDVGSYVSALTKPQGM